MGHGHGDCAGHDGDSGDGIKDTEGTTSVSRLVYSPRERLFQGRQLQFQEVGGTAKKEPRVLCSGRNQYRLSICTPDLCVLKMTWAS